MTKQIHNPKDVAPVPDLLRTVYSHAVEVKTPTRTLYISGQVGWNRQGQLQPDFNSQAEMALDNVEAILRAAQMERTNLVKVTYFVTDAANLPALRDIRRERWGSTEPPAVTVLVVAALARPDFLVEVEAVAAA